MCILINRGMAEQRWMPLVIEAWGTAVSLSLVALFRGRIPIIQGIIMTVLYVVGSYFSVGSYNPFVTYGRYLHGNISYEEMLIHFVGQVIGTIIAYLTLDWIDTKVESFISFIPKCYQI